MSTFETERQGIVGEVDLLTAPQDGALASAPVAIEVRNLAKTFQLPGHKVDTIKERVVHPFARQESQALPALRDVSFEVRRGEFFGIVGRNGSGKSTLLKLLAGIYEADAGRIRMAGTLAPFIELGVGFNAELTAEENIVMNGVMMGLTRSEAQERIGGVLAFAELEDFIDMKLKNYSTGMQVRLAFSMMLQADTDILLIDEVLAVGDAAFQQKCADAFREMRDSGRTVILVTHDMRSVGEYCHRAMLLNDARVIEIGDPHEVARHYLSLNFDHAADEHGLERTRTREETAAQSEVTLLDIWLEGPDGGRIDNVEQGAEIRVGALIEARREIARPLISFAFTDANGIPVFGLNGANEWIEGTPERLEAGQRLRITGRVLNRLATGRYDVSVWIARNRSPTDVALHAVHALDFIVYGTDELGGLVALDHEVTVELCEEDEGP
jgi:ABC-type polysaccharide/polyol phosphate transport system ATPase subunit